MSLEPDAKAEVEQRIITLEHILTTPENWDDTADSTPNKGLKLPLVWTVNKEPSHIFCFDTIVGEFFPEKEYEWKSSGFRANILKSKGGRFDVTPTTDYISAWMRNPHVWNSSDSKDGYIGTPDIRALDPNDRVSAARHWSMICRAVATDESPLPKYAMNELRDIRFSVLRGAAGISLEDFIDASVKTNYNIAIPNTFLTPTLYANLMHKTMTQMSPDMGNGFLWMAALSLVTENTSFYMEDESVPLATIERFMDKGLKPENIIRWHDMGLSVDKMLEFSKYDIENSFIELLLGNSPEYS